MCTLFATRTRNVLTGLHSYYYGWTTSYAARPGDGSACRGAVAMHSTTDTTDQMPKRHGRGTR